MNLFEQLLASPEILAGVLGGLAILATALIVSRRRPADGSATQTPRSQDTTPPKTTATELQKPVAAITRTDTAADVAAIQDLDRAGWLGRLRQGLDHTRQNLVSGLKALFTEATRVDDTLLAKIHETLFRADVGVTTADRLVADLKRRFQGGDSPSWEDIRSALVDEITVLLDVPTNPIVQPGEGPLVILIVGVNGAGKTTTIGKLAAHFMAQDKSVLLAAGDTFRAAAIDQLQVWADRLSIDLVRHKPGSDPAAVAFDAVKAAKARQKDVLLIDTAGRLHNKKELMDELAKIKRVIAKDLPDAPHETWLVIDATTGQNALMQVKAFREAVNLTGLVVTKLDGTAKGGVVIGATVEHQLPIRYVGVGEKAADLRAFAPRDFAESLL